MPHFDDIESHSGSSLELEEEIDESLNSMELEIVIEEPPSEEVYQKEMQKNMALIEGDPSKKYVLLH